MLYVIVKVRKNSADLLHAAVELRVLGSPGVVVLLFFTSMVFYLIIYIDLLNNLCFYSWGERS